ncbi:MAG: glucosyltransferase [Claussenomyces sp. TS43310]|nr:MAG: glucosyltransferase [Claussenomyces sp. TS43310]
MSLFNPTTWSFDYFLLPKGKIPTGTNLSLVRKQAVSVGVILCSVFLLARFWYQLVTEHVLEPYLDEFFHVRQAQKYCTGDFKTWDPKITTPPGLYAVSAAFLRVLRGTSCTISELRWVNCLTQHLLLLVTISCRNLIERRSLPISAVEPHDTAAWTSSYSIHTAVNISLFPLLFFFSGLYYTDVLSTCIVLVAYDVFLKRDGMRPSLRDGLRIYTWGIAALLMRQTNIFWVAIFLAGLEWVRACKELQEKSTSEDSSPISLQERLVVYTQGRLHDRALRDADVTDIFWCAISIAVAAISHPLLLVQYLWPYFALLGSFAGFVLCNGGVVLGDKSNHVATLHLPQMLYIWPFMVFFSFPMMYPAAISVLGWIHESTRPRATSKVVSTRDASVTLSTAFKYALWLAASLSAVLIIIRFNTIIHPFTLADNRHYVFYIFRYTIRRHPLIKYLLAPAYIVCSFFVFQCSAGSPDLSRSGTPKVVEDHKPAKSSKNKVQTPKRPPQPPKWTWLRVAPPSDQTHISTMLIWLIATTLSLITAPLVEPRYLIISWIIWRLHVPALPPTSRQQGRPEKDVPGQRDGSWTHGIRSWAYRHHDRRLWFETAWFLAINAVTGYVFLFRGFAWPSEPGTVQRFMW